MSNKYFPDEQIGFNDIYFVCYMIERVARRLHQSNRYVVEHLGAEGLERQLSIAQTNHCLNPVNGNQKCSDFGNSECSIFGIKTTVLLASAVQ